MAFWVRLFSEHITGHDDDYADVDVPVSRALMSPDKRRPVDNRLLVLMELKVTLMFSFCAPLLDSLTADL